MEVIEDDVEIETAAEPKKKRGGFLKFLKPGKTMKSAEESASDEVQASEVDEVAQNN